MKPVISQVQLQVILMALYTCKHNTPDTHDEFQNYVKTTTSWQISDQENVSPPQPVYLRLGWTQTDSEKWSAKCADWANLYQKYINASLCTSLVRQATAKFIVDFHAFARPFLKKLTASGTALQEDAEIFHVVLNPKKASPTHSQLEYSISGIFSDAAPGKINAKAIWNEESKRASRAPGSSHEEYSWLIVPLDDKNQPDLKDIIKKMIAPTDEFKSDISTKAKFVMELKAENSGRYVIVFLRWYVDTDEARSSNYSIAYLLKIP